MKPTTTIKHNLSNLFLTNKTEKIAVILLVAMHIAGVVGLLLPATRPLFKSLIPFNLLANVATMLYFQKDWNKYAVVACITILLVGFGIEVVGVQTKMIFGDYWYKTTLGIKVLDTPLLIAINWLIVIYSTSAIVAEFRFHRGLKVLFATILTVALDFLLEPVAMRLDFWDWKSGTIPMQNYIGWAGTAFLLHTILIFLPFEKRNRVAVILYICEVFFFILLRRAIHFDLL